MSKKKASWFILVSTSKAGLNAVNMIFQVAKCFVLDKAGLSDRKVGTTHHLLVAGCFCRRHCVIYRQCSKTFQCLRLSLLMCKWNKMSNGLEKQVICRIVFWTLGGATLSFVFFPGTWPRERKHSQHSPDVNAWIRFSMCCSTTPTMVIFIIQKAVRYP